MYTKYISLQINLKEFNLIYYSYVYVIYFNGYIKYYYRIEQLNTKINKTNFIY